MKPQASIEQTQAGFVIQYEDDGQSQTVDENFDSYQQALDFILQQGWQLKREAPKDSLHVETRFIKP